MTACVMATMAQQISQATAGSISPVGVIPEVMMRAGVLLFKEEEEK